MTDITETEEQLINTAQQALSNCRWVVGECAYKWTRRYARGRTDADFGQLIGLSPDQVYQRRRVWETFADVREQFGNLRWSHFYAAINWDDSAECLQWAEETQSTVAEMKAWRRASRGEDLTAEPTPEEEANGLVGYIPNEMAYVQDPAEFAGGRSERARPAGESASFADGDEGRMALAGVARGLEQEAYAPFKTGATKPPPSDRGESSEPRMSPDQLAKKLCSTLERCAKSITPEMARGFRVLPDKMKERLQGALAELTEKLAQL